jgi:nitroreductase
VFATDYIEETVAVLTRQVADDQKQDPERRWACAVLTDYFRVTDPGPQTDRARARFNGFSSTGQNPNEPLVPYKRDLRDPPSVSYEALWALAQRRRSVRWFLPKPTPRDLIDKAIEIAAQSPSACNRQPFIFRVFDDPESVKQIAAIPMGTTGYADNIPAIVVIVGQLRHFSDERDRHLIYIDGSLAAMSFAFALETLGLSSCMINWPDVEHLETRMASLIGLEADERPVMLIAVGYPDPEGLVAASVKKPVALLRRYN